MNIGQAIKEIRLRNKIPQAVFAKEICGVSKVTLYAIEKGIRLPSKKVLDEIKANLGIPYEYIVMYSMMENDIEAVKRTMFFDARKRFLEKMEKDAEGLPATI